MLSSLAPRHYSRTESCLRTLCGLGGSVIKPLLSHEYHCPWLSLIMWPRCIPPKWPWLWLVTLTTNWFHWRRDGTRLTLYTNCIIFSSFHQVSFTISVFLVSIFLSTIVLCCNYYLQRARKAIHIVYERIRPQTDCTSLFKCVVIFCKKHWEQIAITILQKDLCTIKYFCWSVYCGIQIYLLISLGLVKRERLANLILTNLHFPSVC